MNDSRAVRILTTVGTALLAAILLASCAPGEPTPVPTDARSPMSSPTSSSTPSPTADPDPVFLPTGTATENRTYFDFVNAKLFASASQPDGRSIIDNLVAAGFNKPGMAVTPDTTSIGDRADSIIFSVLVKGQCLIGQIMGSGYYSQIAPVLGTGGCLIGQTRPIDW